MRNRIVGVGTARALAIVAIGLLAAASPPAPLAAQEPQPLEPEPLESGPTELEPLELEPLDGEEPPRQGDRRAPRAAPDDPFPPLPAGVEGDRRGIYYLRYDCRSEIGRREVTLFANGTVRLKKGPPNEETMRLAEIGPGELTAYLNRLAQEDLSETDRDAASVGGDWVEVCDLELALPRAEVDRFRFDLYHHLSLALSRVVAVADELIAVSEAGQRGRVGLPAGYRPEIGDQLERADGVLFEVAGLTADKRGVELQGVSQPLVLYVAIADLRGEFVRLVERR